MFWSLCDFKSYSPFLRWGTHHLLCDPSTLHLAHIILRKSLTSAPPLHLHLVVLFCKSQAASEILKSTYFELQRVLQRN
jgi:hypothetical protein